MLPSWLASLRHETAAMRRAGVRRLLVISGESAWCSQQAAALKTLLGREFLHALFDARQALSVDALVAGSWLVLLVPPWLRWPRLPDGDSRRWSEQPQPIATPYFTRYFRASLSARSGGGAAAPGSCAADNAPIVPPAVACACPRSAQPPISAGGRRLSPAST